MDLNSQTAPQELQCYPPADCYKQSEAAPFETASFFYKESFPMSLRPKDSDADKEEQDSKQFDLYFKLS